MFTAGQKIGSYILVKRLGRGGFGEVWLADWETKFATTKVAVKLPIDEQIDHALIEQEAQLWAKASGHTNVLPIIEANEYDGQIVIVSEYAPDGSLEQLLKTGGGKLPVKQAVEMTINILNGLEFLHSRNIIHRDLKPANVLLQGETPRLADFGISRAMRTTMASRSQHISGTFAYMSPEALDGKRTVQTDIWSVGVNLYQLLTGKLPFPQTEPSMLFPAIIMREPEPLPDFVPPELNEIIAKTLEKNPEKRYQTSVEMREDLRKYLQLSLLRTPIDNSPKTSETETVTEVVTSIAPKPKASPTPIKSLHTNSESVVTKVRVPIETEEAETVVSTRLPSPKVNPLYYIIPSVLLLILTSIGIGYWFNSQPGETSAVNSIKGKSKSNENKNVALTQQTSPAKEKKASNDIGGEKNQLKLKSESEIVKEIVRKAENNESVTELTKQFYELKRSKAEQILQRVKNGEDFGKLANQYSQDPGSKKYGGLYEGVQEGQFLPEFEKAALALKSGQVSPNLVKTEVGYHIIKLEKKEENSYNVRHILFTSMVKDPNNPNGQEIPLDKLIEKYKKQ